MFKFHLLNQNVDENSSVDQGTAFYSTNTI